MRGAFVYFGATLLCGICLAQPAPTATTKPAELDTLIADLSCANYAKRDAAAVQIALLGVPATQPIKQLMESSRDLDTRMRARSILEALDGGEFPKASIVTLNFKDAAATLEVYNSLYKQAHSLQPVVGPGRFGPAPKSVTIDVQNVPFWQAMRTLYDKTKLAPALHFEKGLSYDPFGSMSGQTSITGPFMVVSPEDRGRFEKFSVYVEPRFRVLAHEPYPKIVEAIDDKGEAYGLRWYSQRDEDWRDPERNVFEVSSSAIQGRGDRIAFLKGAIAVRLLVQTRTVEFENLDDGKEHEVTADRHVFTARLTQEAAKCSIGVSAYNPHPWKAGTSDVELKFVDEDGKALEWNNNKSITTPDGSHIKRDVVQPAGVGKPSKLIIEYVAESRVVNIPFEFGRKPK